MSALALKTASGVAAAGGLAVIRTLVRLVALWFMGAVWLATLLTVAWPFWVAYVVVGGREHRIVNLSYWAIDMVGFLILMGLGYMQLSKGPDSRGRARKSP